MINRIRQGVSTIGIMLMLALMLLTQSLSLQASVEMVAGDLPGLQQRGDCGVQSQCDHAMNEDLADCCAAEIERHCASGLCSVAMGLNNTPILAVAPGGLPPESMAVPLVGAVQSPPYPPPKAD